MSTTAHLVRAQGTRLPTPPSPGHCTASPCRVGIHPRGPFPRAFLGDKGGRDLLRWVPGWDSPPEEPGRRHRCILSWLLEQSRRTQQAQGKRWQPGLGAGRGVVQQRGARLGEGDRGPEGCCAQPCRDIPWGQRSARLFPSQNHPSVLAAPKKRINEAGPKEGLLMAAASAGRGEEGRGWQKGRDLPTAGAWLEEAFVGLLQKPHSLRLCSIPLCVWGKTLCPVRTSAFHQPHT